MSNKTEWCWFEDESDNPKGPFPTRKDTIEDANTVLDKEKSDSSTFLIAPCLHPVIGECFPESDNEVAGHILGMLDDNTEEFFRDPDELSYSVVEGANVKALRDFIEEWAKKYVKHIYLIPDPNATEEISRTVKKE